MMKTYKILYILMLITGISLNSYSQQYWLTQPSPTHYLLSKCIFVDSLYAWAVGDSGTIIHSSNGGQNWVLQNSGINNYPLDDVFFLNQSLGWALCNDFYFHGTFILKTTNGGETWNNSRFADTTLVLRSIYYTDSLTGYMGDFSGRILKTNNGGNTWQNCVIDSTDCFSFTVYKINFINAQTGYACGGHMDIVGMIWRTTNAGSSWHPFCVSSEPLHDIKFSNGKIISVGGDFEYGATSVTSLNGTIWNYNSSGCFGIGQTVSFRTPAEAWVPLGSSRKWMVSTDSAKSGSWNCIQAPDSTSVYAVHFISAGKGWAFGSGGAIYKYNSAVIGIKNNQTIVPANYILYQNYPNPFNPSTIIKFDLMKSSDVTLKVFDVTGREVVTLFNGFSIAGTHSNLFDAKNLASGIYIYQIIAKNHLNGAVDFNQFRKMVLLK